MEAIHSRGVRDQCVLVSNAISHSILSLLGPGDRLKAFIDADGSGIYFLYFFFSFSPTFFSTLPRDSHTISGEDT